MTLGGALAAKARLIVWCKTRQHPAEPDMAERVARYGADASRARVGAPAALLDLRRPGSRFRGQRRMR